MIHNGDKVVLTDRYAEYGSHIGEVFNVMSDPYMHGEDEVVPLDGSLGCIYCTDGLRPATEEEIRDWEWILDHGFMDCRICASYREVSFSGSRFTGLPLEDTYACLLFSEPSRFSGDEKPYVTVHSGKTGMCECWTDAKGRPYGEVARIWRKTLAEKGYAGARREFGLEEK